MILQEDFWIVIYNVIYNYIKWKIKSVKIIILIKYYYFYDNVRLISLSIIFSKYNFKLRNRLILWKISQYEQKY